MEAAGMSAAELATITGLDAKTVRAIANGNFTASPSQRERIAAALGIPKDEISWEHAIGVQHLRGNGSQTGRQT